MKLKLSKQVIFFITIAIGLTIGALYLNSAVYHLWLADGPPVDDPVFHLKAFYKHASISVVGLAVAVVVFIVYWKKRKQSLK